MNARAALQEPGTFLAPDQRVPPLEHLMVVEGVEEPRLGLDSLPPLRDPGLKCLHGALTGRLDPVPRSLEGAAGRMGPEPGGQELGLLPARAHPRGAGPREALVDAIQLLASVLDPLRGPAERVGRLEPAKTRACVAELAHDALARVAAEIEERALALLEILHHELRGVGGRGRAHVRRQIGERDVHLVPDGRDHRDPRAHDGADHGLLVESPEILRRAPSPADHDHLDSAEGVHAVQRLELRLERAVPYRLDPERANLVFPALRVDGDIPFHLERDSLLDRVPDRGRAPIGVEHDQDLGQRILEAEVGVPAGGVLDRGDLSLDEHDADPVLERVPDIVRELGDGVDAALPAGNGEREHAAALAHRAPSCASTASARFWSRSATVIGPTPPGTGVTAEATPRTDSKSTSPSNFGPPGDGFSIGWMPTSITTAPGRT